MIKILTVFGTRPEAIKMAPLIIEFRKHPDKVKLTVCVTGQHKDMLDQVLNLFEIKPDFDLEIMKPKQDLFEIFTASMLGMKKVLAEVNPDLVLVHGDTSSSTAAALSSFFFKIPVGHVEAGLRTYKMYNPWPEELNRQINSRLSSFHFTPTESSKINLLKEGTLPDSIFVTGNTVIDSLQIISEKIDQEIKKNPSSLKYYLPKIPWDSIQPWLDGSRRMILITAHRRENFGDGFQNVFQALKELSNEYENVDFVFPIHLNPNVRASVEDVFGTKSNEKSNLFFTDPLEYLPFIFLLKSCYFVMTDSGGIQEEAPGLGKPVLVFRETTERPEAVEAGTVLLVGTDKTKIKDSAKQLLNNPEFYYKMSKALNPYGDGFASKRIVEEIFNRILK
ncbi:UDP-N-acetylglucosamine 2-epimerase (non-hydrolyzing) [Algoriphagus kandeliae]|uniref:UDP-N-acetylglucosamine 2-epimerase (non-hydrolyzing) n=1 Tax=Algoriphagus kandeliae TaxID=2562278 RepID=A0A4Y9QY16_9BACT|nr:UDP-N-acetylglucosamine 2-epimerase (non-hydrolyzing) [Algoriphagus kandeliae]TFV97239.1 UDP-N-acetylglucosamine 2-epimerase (non-hydrolyzing) [Algoriphagus kandeliae]